MDKDKDRQAKLNKRAAALRANLKRRKDVAKAKADKTKDNNKEDKE